MLCLVVTGIGVAWPAWDMFGPARRPMLQGWDDSFYYYWLPSAIIDHDLDFANQLATSGTIDPATRDLTLSLGRTATGVPDVKYPPGWAIGSLPFFLFAHAIAPAGSTGFEPVYLVHVWLGQIVYVAAGLWLAIRILSRFFPANTATVAVLATWLASPLVYYQSARLSMSHSQVFALVMATYWLAFRLHDGDMRARNWVLLGFTSALLVVTRNAALVYLFFPALVVLRRVRSFSPIAWLALGAVPPLAAQIVAWKLIFGTWIAYSYGGERLDFTNLHLYGVLFSPRHGWFYWHPLLLLTIGSFTVWGWNKLTGRAWLASLVVIVLMDAAWPTWWLGSSFGHRGFATATFFGMAGLAALLNYGRTRTWIRRGTLALATAAIAWNLILFALFLTQRIPREEAVTYADAGLAFLQWFSPVNGHR